MSQFALFHVPAREPGEWQKELNAFLRSHRIVGVERHYEGGGWAFCIEWLEHGEVSWKTKPRMDYMKVLPPDVFQRFSSLRAKRKAIAEADGVPPFMVLTDEQMAEAAKVEVLTLDDLKGIRGLGEARIKKYGDRLLGS